MLPAITGDLVVTDTDVPAILATIRATESGGDYTARARTASASGAYQYLDSTWAGYGGYASAYLAPREVQDARAAEDVRRILAANGNRAAAVFASWYWPRALNDPTQLDVVPMASAGNRLTVRAYTELQLGKLAAALSSALRWPSPGDVADTIGDVVTWPAEQVSNVATSAAGALVSAAGRVVVIGAVLAGAVALVVIGTRKAVQP